MLEEIVTPEHRNAGALLGFALGQARLLLTPARRAVFFMQRTGEAQELGLPYGMGLRSFGFAPDALILVRVTSSTELLWALEEALGCLAVAAVIADVAGDPKAFDFTASRRLSLRARSAGAVLLVLRYGTARVPSAARRRWRLDPATSGQAPFDARAPGQPRWRVTLEKGQLSHPSGASAGSPEFLLDWTENGFVLVDENKTGRFAPPFAAHPGPDPAALGDRMRQTA